MRRNSWPRLRFALIAAALLVPLAASAKDREFDAIVHRVSAQYHKRPMRFMGLLSFIANRFTPHGVSHLKMAIFEDLDLSRPPADPQFDPFMQDLVGPSYQPFVRVLDKRSGERTLIYAREEDKEGLEMLIVSLEPDEAVVMKIRLDPDAVLEWVAEPIEKGRGWGHDRGGSSGQ
jgi:hypothetical protein